MATTTKTKRKSTYIRFLNGLRQKFGCTAMEVEGHVSAALSAEANTRSRLEGTIKDREERIKELLRELGVAKATIGELEAKLASK